LNHAIAGKAVMLKQCATPEFRDYAGRIVANAKALAAGLTQRGQVLVTGGTDNHLMVLDLRPMGLKGRQVQSSFDTVGITLNANAFPGHGGSPFNPNGIRMGTPAVTTRGMGEGEMDAIAGLVDRMLRNIDDSATQEDVRRQSLDLCRKHPLDYRRPVCS
jgi:glycine hydroxymethyltransferase